MNLEELYKATTRETSENLIKGLKTIKAPKDFNEDVSYNLIQYAVTIYTLQGKNLQEISDILHTNIEEALTDFVNQIIE